MLALECGLRYSELQRALNFQVSRLHGCLVSHEHMDHARAAKEVARAGVDIYASHGTLTALELSGTRFNEIKAHEEFDAGHWRVYPFDIVHDAVEPLGFFLMHPAGWRVLYATDTAYLRYTFEGMTHILIETNYEAETLRERVSEGRLPAVVKRRITQSHFSLEHVKGFLRANDLNRVREIWLLHLSDSNADAVQFKREVQELTGKPVYVA